MRISLRHAVSACHTVQRTLPVLVADAEPGTQLHRLAVRRVAIGIGPSLFAFVQRCVIGQSLWRSPASPGLPASGCNTRMPSSASPRSAASASSAARVSAHSFHVKCPCAESRTASAKACACHGSANTGPASSRGRLCNSGKQPFRSGTFKVVVPQVDVDRIAGRSLIAPKLTCRELHRVHMLSFLTQPMSVGIGENIDSVIAVDLTHFASRITGQPCMAGWIDIAGAHALAHLEPRFDGWIVAGRDVTIRAPPRPPARREAAESA